MQIFGGAKIPFLELLETPNIRCPVGGSIGGCGARAVSRKTPIYFIRIWVHFIENSDVISLVIDQPSSKFKGWQ